MTTTPLPASPVFTHASVAPGPNGYRGTVGADAVANALADEGVELDRIETVEMPAGPPLLVAHAPRQREALEALLRLVPRTGRWPVALGARGSRDDVIAEILDPGLGPREDPRNLLGRAEGLGLDRWLQERQQQMDEYGDDWIPEPGDFEPDAEPDEDMVSDGPARIVLPATPHPWEVPAYLWFGNWNDCPAPHEHVAVQKAWHERYGAAVVLAEPDLLVMHVERPPETEEEARALAWQYFLYDTDAVYQGTDTLGGLASSVAGARTWTFWWD